MSFKKILYAIILILIIFFVINFSYSNKTIECRNPLDCESIDKVIHSLSIDVEHLDIFGASLGDKRLKILIERLQNCKNLKSIDLSMNELTKVSGEAIGKAMQNGTFENLKILKLDSNFFEEDGITALAEGLPNLKNLEELSISMNTTPDFKKKIGKGIEALSDSLKSLKNLKILNLWDTGIDTKGIALLSYQLPSNIEELILSDNPIGYQGITCLSKKLCELLKIKKLSLSNMYIGDNGLKILVDILIKLPNLNELTIGNDSFITEEGMKYFIDALMKGEMKNLKSVWCMYTNTSKEFQEKSEKTIKTFRKNLQLRLS